MQLDTLSHDIASAAVSVDSFQRMVGSFTDWSIHDAQWYFEQFGLEASVNGDTQTVSLR